MFGVIMVLMFTLFPNAYGDDVIRLRLSTTSMSANDLQSQSTYQPWIDEIEKLTAGKVEIKHYSAGQLVPPPETYDAVVSGIADIGINWIGMTPGRFPLFESFNLNKLDAKCARPSRASWELYNAIPEIQKEFAQTKVLGTACVTAYPPGVGLGTTKKPIRKMEDLKGLKIQGGGKWSTMKIAALGAAPMHMNIVELYETLEKGVLDGGLVSPLMFDTFRFKEVIHYHTSVNFMYMPFFLSMNWNTWNKLPPDIQKAFENASQLFADLHDENPPRLGNEAIERAVKENGLEVITLTPQEMARWNKAIQPVRDEYIKNMESKGLPGKKVLEETERLFAKYAK